MEILSVSKAKIIDKKTIEEVGVPSIVLMENAGSEIAKSISEKGESFLICCGCGNNGGDGLVIARKLMLKEKKVKVIIIGNPEKGTNDFCINYRILKNMKADIDIITVINESFTNYLSEYDIVLDCIFGVGLNREVEGVFYDAIAIINEFGKYIISVDIPSGLDGDKGNKKGISIKADETYTIQVYKKGFLSYEALELLGKVSIVDIGILNETIKQNSCNISFIDKENITRQLPKRKLWGHKGNYGKVVVLAGSEEYTGAAYLVSQAAVKTGAGLVTLIIDDVVRGILAGKLVEAMTVGYKEKNKIDRLIKEATVIACGPGLGKGEKSVEKLKYVIKNSNCPLVLDADALNILSENKDLFEYIRNKAVITPHMGEMSRLTGKSIEFVDSNKLEICKEFSSEYGIITLLKGYYTLISDGINIRVNNTGSSCMASGGMGDVLTGIIASLIGQGMEVFQATQLGANIHGAIGDFFSETNYSVNAQRLVDEIPYFMKKYLK